MFINFRSQSLSFITKLFGDSDNFYKDFRRLVGGINLSSVKAGRAILNAIKTEIENGWLSTFKEIVSAEIFTDFLEMAEYLLKEDYKDPATVMIGGVLEEHLRQLCQKNSVDTVITKGTDIIPKKAEAMNTDLYKTGIYDKGDQKQVTAWLDLRNKAAHGKYSEYTKEQVDLMYQGVLNFISRVN